MTSATIPTQNHGDVNTFWTFWPCFPTPYKNVMITAPPTTISAMKTPVFSFETADADASASTLLVILARPSK